MKTYVSEDRCTLVRTWEDTPELGALDGPTIVEVAVRPDPDAVWGPPVRLTEEGRGPAACAGAKYGTETEAGVVLSAYRRRYPDSQVGIKRCSKCLHYHLVPAGQR